MTSKNRRVLLLITMSTVFFLGLVIESYGASATIDYEYDEVGNVKKKTVTYSGFPQTVSCTVDTYPTGLLITVDNTSYTAPHIFNNWTPGSQHTISVPSPQSGGAGIRYAYYYWFPDYGAQTHTVTPSSDTTYVAYFNTQYSLTTTASPSQGGSVNPSGTNWYDGWQNVQVSAIPSSGYSFFNWSGDLTGSVTPAYLTMNGPKSVTANFTQQYTLTTSVSPSGSGLVTKYPDKAWYSPGEQVTLTAGATTSYSFGSWTGNVTGTTNIVTMTMDGNKTATANFSTCGNDPFKVGTQYYSSLQSAYAAAGTNGTVKCRGIEYNGNLDVNRTTTGITVQGGYDCGFSAYSGNMTFLKGKITTQGGAAAVIIGNFILEQ